MNTSGDPMDTRQLVLSVAEAAAMLGISKDLAYDLIARGELPSLRLGRRIVVPRVALFALVGATDYPTTPVAAAAPIVADVIQGLRPKGVMPEQPGASGVWDGPDENGGVSGVIRTLARLLEIGWRGQAR
jgi:excisionase family DNA binding protein